MPRIRQDVTGSSFVTGSGFIVRSPRILLNELDDNPGSYPTVRRTGDPTRSGTRPISFNDGTTIDFVSNGNPVFPMMLPRNSSFITQSVDILGEQSDISITAPIRSFQQPAHLHYSPVEEMGPFDENRTMPATDFFLSGTDPDILPGFTSPVRSKIAIEIDITPQTDAMVMRNVRRRNIAEGQPVSDDNTGFLYYNFSRRVWEQIGAIDPATGGPLYYDYAIDNSTPSTLSGTFPLQFQFTTDVGFGEDEEQLKILGYPKIGSPIFTYGAPSLEKYHATSSQSIKLSEYLSYPFLLESVEVSFDEVEAQRINGGVAPSSHFPSLANYVKSGSIRDIDNYTFFAYRQSRQSRNLDSLADVSGSSRFLIFSSSMAFWNSGSTPQGILRHTPAFNHNFNLPYTDTYAVGSFTGSVQMQFKPAVSSAQFAGLSCVPQADGTGTNFLVSSWPGGTSNQNYQSLSRDPSNFAIVANGSAGDSTNLSSKFVRLDSRSIRRFGGESNAPASSSNGNYFSILTPQSDVSPYILMPDDELIFGLEAGVAPATSTSNFSHITGSFLRIKSKPCKVTLYGSMIKDGVEHLHSLNQDLTSDSIHEFIGAEPVLDRFQIEPISSYYGSYLDEIVTGSMLTPVSGGLFFTTQSQDNSRKVISRVSLGQAGTTGSLQRFASIVDSTEIVYDSCLPDYDDVILTSGEASEYKYNGGNVLRYSTGIDNILEVGDDSIFKQFPFEGNPTRRVQHNAAIINAIDNLNTDVMSFPITVTGKRLCSLDYAFLTRYTFVSDAPLKFLYDLRESIFPLPVPPSEYNLTSGLVSSYFMSMSDGGIVSDITSNNYDLDFNSNPLPTNNVSVPLAGLNEDYSLFFAAAAFSGQVRYGETPATIDNSIRTTAVSSTDEAFTISVSFYYTSTSGGSGNDQTLLEKSYRTGGGYNEYNVYIDGSDKLHVKIFQNSSNSNWKGAVTSSAVKDGQWNQITIVYNGDETENNGANCIKVYLNGSQMTVVDDSNSPGGVSNYNAASKLWLAAASNAATGPSATKELSGGYVHSLHIWKSRALTSTEVAALYRAEFLGVTCGIIKHRAGHTLNGFGLHLRNGTFRYGISNLRPANSRLTFSSNHHGYLRDTLEQRYDTAFVSVDPPVKCLFVSGTQTVDPTLTFSQNISTFATSSVPYFDDGTTRNREDLAVLVL